MSHNNPPKEQGTDFERVTADYAASKGLPWDRAPLPQRLLDIDGCLSQGLLIECKALSPRAEKVKANGQSGLSQRMAEGVIKFPGAMEALAAKYPGDADDVIPFVVVQRPRLKIGKAYAVTTFDFLIELAWQRADDFERFRR